MSHRLNLWHYGLAVMIVNLALFIVESKDLALALNKLDGIYSSVLLPTLALELGFILLAIKYSKSWNSVSASRKNVFHVLTVAIFLGLFLAANFTNSFLRDALSSLLISFISIYFIFIGLAEYRNYLSGLSKNQ